MQNSSIKLLYILVATLMAGALQSCDDDYFNGGDATKVTITATTAFSNTTSRAVFEEDTYFESGDIVITNYCFLLFDDEKKLIKSIDIAPTAFPYIVELPQPVVGKTYHAFLLGNVTTGTLSAVTTIDELQNSTFEINRMYNTPTDKKLFTWSDYLSVTQARKNLDFILNPNVAKITAKITNSSSESVIKSVRVKNVVNEVGYAQNALNEYSPDYVKNVSEPTFIKYDIETFDTPIEFGESKTISWYVPQNIQGEGTRIPEGNKANETYLHGEIPDNATYVEIDGVRTADNVTASYRVYPGIKKDKKEGEEEETYAEMTNFDVKADVIYNLDITINNDGIDNESTNITTGYKPNSGTTATAKIKLPENSNCYMIHPIGDRIADVTVYELPISRVNQYWATVAGEPGTEADDHALTADSKWHVEVIWQDINKRAIEFCDEYGVSTEKDANGEVYSPGEGLNPFCFKLVNNSNTPGSQTYGNVLVGLKKDGVEGYCWSWHLWITDYNPDKATPYDGSATLIWQTNNEIDLQGEYVSSSEYDKSFTNTSSASLIYHRVHWGNVQHYNSLWDWYWKTNPNSANVWDGTGIYAKKWIMDRNLGAISCNVGNEYNPLDGWGLYYQYGRKDPFSYKIVYDITGTQKKFNYEKPGVGSPQWTHQNKQASSFSESVMNPNDYYAVITNGSDAATMNWIGGSPLESKWYSPKNDPMSPNLERNQKTLFDPCPPGWCVPSVDAFDFASRVFNPNDNTSVPDGYTFGAEKGTVKATDFAYARYYANDLEYSFDTYQNPNDQYAHTAVTVHVDVKGAYDKPADNADIDAQHSEYNSNLTGYGDRERMFATIYSSTPYNRLFKALKSVFPLQGRIAGDGSTAGKLGSISDLNNPTLPTKEVHTNVYYYDIDDKGVKQEWLPNYFCANEQGCLWTLDNGGDDRQATLILFQPVTLNNRINARQEVSGNRLFMRFHGYMRTANWAKSRGQNVRCIQEPD